MPNHNEYKSSIFRSLSIMNFLQLCSSNEHRLSKSLFIASAVITIPIDAMLPKIYRSHGTRTKDNVK